MKDVVILGAGGTGEDVVDLIAEINVDVPVYRCVGFLDDDPEKHGTAARGIPVLGELAAITSYPEAGVVDALGSPHSYRERPDVISRLQIDAERFVSVVHPTAVLSRAARLGPGSILYPFVMVGSGATLGRHVIALSHCAINHHAIIGDFTILASGVTVSGKARVGKACYLGAGCSLRDGVTIGDGSLVGMGSVVIDEVAPGTVVAGSPARPIRRAD